MAFTLDSVGKRHTLYRDAQTGLYRAELAIHDQRYDTGSGLATVVEALEADGTEGFALRANRLRHAVRLTNDGTRRWYPRRNVPTEYVEFGRPEYWTGADWQPLVLGTPVQPDPGSLLWVKPAYAVQLTLNWRRLKMDLRLKTSAAARRVRWPVSLVGLGWSDWSLLGQDGTTVGRIDRPTAEDANGVAVPLTVQYAGGYVSVLADLTGVAYPVVIDPTFTSTQTSADADCYLDGTNATSKNYNTGASVWLETYRTTGALGIRNSLLKIDLSLIPAGSTVISASQQLTALKVEQTATGTIAMAQLLAANSDWVEGVKNWATAGTNESCWNYRKYNTTAWAGSAGAETSGTDYDSTDDGTANWSGDPAAGTNITITLDPGRVQNLLTANYGWHLRETVAEKYMVWASSDHGTAVYRPKLVIEYSTGNPYYAYAQQ